jgi:ABC-type nickel/cobalt efflux system permease component RcnA
MPPQVVVLLLLGAGFLIGMRHALEADHLAAVVSLSTRSTGRLASMRRGAAWGLGHTTALLVVGGGCLAWGTSLSETQADWLERLVGAMLVALGVQVVLRMRRNRVHVHVHRHDDGVVHLHAHRHAAGEGQAIGAHHHDHPSNWRAGAVGLVHGMAGSAALVVLVSSSVGSFWTGLAYIASFGVGSILGMAVLSFAIAMPLEFSARRLNHVYGLVEVPLAVGTVALGLSMLG